jgi:Flp pilus assembly protein TadD
VAYSAAGCRTQAENAYRRALALNPNYTLARDNLASLMERGTQPPRVGC